MAAAGAARRRQELAGEAKRHLEEANAAAFQILSSINYALCNPALWSPSSSSPSRHQIPHSPVSDSEASSSDVGNVGGGADPGGSLDEARHRYKTAVAALRASVTAVFSCSQEMGPTEDKADQAEIERLEELASVLRKEIESRNKHVKLLIDQLRGLISDISMWPSPRSVCIGSSDAEPLQLSF